MTKTIEMKGRVFSRLTVLERSGSNAQGKAKWKCRCSCGKTKKIDGTKLRNSRVQSCGCLHMERCLDAVTIHGMTGTKEYRAWMAMRGRCHDRRNKKYQIYGGRGIFVCDRWINSFPNFFEDIGNAPTKKHSLGRINNDGPYSPDNCRWETVHQQANNRSNVRIIFYNGKSKSLAEWERVFGLTKRRIAERLKCGWTVEKALSPPFRRS